MQLGESLQRAGGGVILAKKICSAPPPVVSLKSDGLRQAQAVVCYAIGHSISMKLFYYFLTIIILSFAACNAPTSSRSQPSTFVDTNKTFKKEIPLADIFYTLAKAKQRQLGLDSLENGFDNLQVRVWYDFALVRERKLVVITNRDAVWTAVVYDLQVDWDGQTETILSKNVKQVTPKSGWVTFSKRLLELKIVTLPNQDVIEGYYQGTDGETYNVEVASKNRYRFYGYWAPGLYRDKFWQAKNMTEILNLFETELGVLSDY